MRLTKFGHSCLLVEEGGARVLLDPGSFSEGFEELDGLTAVCLTHHHGDHLDAERVRRVLKLMLPVTIALGLINVSLLNNSTFGTLVSMGLIAAARSGKVKVRNLRNRHPSGRPRASRSARQRSPVSAADSTFVR